MIPIGQIEEKLKKWGGPQYEYRKRILRHIFKKNDIKGKSILDIGAGSGLACSFFISEYGAKEVFAVDSYEGYGSPASSFDKIKELQNILGKRLEVIQSDIFDYSPLRNFGFILASNSLHHIVPSKKRLTDLDVPVKQRIVMLLENIGGWLEDRGKLQILEVARRNISPIPRYRKRYKRFMDLSTKQDPWHWIYALRKAGFKKIRVTYPPPVILDRFKMIHFIFNTYVSSILTGSTYIITTDVFTEKMER